MTMDATRRMSDADRAGFMARSPEGHAARLDLGLSPDSKTAEKELKVVTPEKSKAWVTAFTKSLVTTYQLRKTRSVHIILE